MPFNKNPIETQNKNQFEIQNKDQNKNQKFHNWNKEPHATIFLTEDEETSDIALIYYLSAIYYGALILNIIWYWFEKWHEDYLIPACYAHFRYKTLLSFVIYVFVLFEWKEMFLNWDMYFDWY